jgi:hypothetical protein
MWRFRHFHTSTIDGGQSSAWRSGRFTPEEKGPSNKCGRSGEEVNAYPGRNRDQILQSIGLTGPFFFNE